MLPIEAGCDNKQTVKKVYRLQIYMNVKHMFLYNMLMDILPTIIIVQVRLYKLIETAPSNSTYKQNHFMSLGWKRLQNNQTDLRDANVISI